MNVPAGKLSWFESDPTHFVGWLNRKSPGVYSDSSFVPRRLFGDYLREMSGAIDETRHMGTVGDVRRAHAGLSVELVGGHSLAVDNVVFATGLPLRPQRLIATPQGKTWIYSGTALHELPRLSELSRIHILGSGLTAIDVIALGEASDFKGSYVVSSSHGRFPLAHGPSVSIDIDPILRAPTLHAKVQAFFDLVRTADGSPSEERIRGVVDAIRPHSATLWGQLLPEEQQRFLQRGGLKSRWDRVRHRCPPPLAGMVTRLQGSGRLEVKPTTVRDIEAVAAGIGPDEIIVDCRGVGGVLDDPLVKKVSARREVLARRGQGVIPVDRDVFCVGATCRGVEFETTAVPKLRKQAERIAEEIAARTPLSHRGEEMRDQLVVST